MTEPRAPGFQFECSLCGEESFGVPTIVNKRHQYVVDEECAAESIAPMLLAAQASEYSYPPLWGSTVVDHRRFLHLLPEDFAEKYAEKRQEYKTPLDLRIYCRNQRRKELEGLKEQCGAFVGERAIALDQGLNRNYLYSWFRCRICSARCCNTCGGIVPLEDRWQTVLHRCATPMDDDASAFDGLVRGVHYQICPGCGMKVELAEACNALKCLGYVCRTSFCAICGHRAKHDSGHWQLGKPCPRWNKPSDANAGFDPVPVAVEPPRTAEWVAAERWLSTELAGWRGRSWNAMIVRDEKHTIYLLHVSNLAAKDFGIERDEDALQQFNLELETHLEAHFRELGFNGGLPHARARAEELYGRLSDEENLTILRHLLLLHKDAVQVLPLHRGVGQHLTKEHLARLQVNYVCKYFSIIAVWDAIDEYFMLDYPRLIDTLQRTIDELEWLIIDIREDLEDDLANEAAEPNARNQLDVPVVEDWPGLWADSYEVYKKLEDLRLSMIELGFVRPPRLAAAIDMFWLQYRNLQVPKRFREAISARERNALMINFLANDQEIELRREEMGTGRWPQEVTDSAGELWKATMEGYTEFAQRFKRVVPVSVLVNYQRGWLD